MQKKLFVLLFVLHSILAFSQNSLKTYQILLDEIEMQQKKYAASYSTANNLKKDTVIKEARAYLLAILSNEIFPNWYGTPWDFNGMTRTPRKGKIACGYFVCNILKDIGFTIPRIKWAQSASIEP